jgi:hypothetical protein
MTTIHSIQQLQYTQENTHKTTNNNVQNYNGMFQKISDNKINDLHFMRHVLCKVTLTRIMEYSAGNKVNKSQSPCSILQYSCTGAQQILCSCGLLLKEPQLCARLSASHFTKPPPVFDVFLESWK